MSKRGKRQRKIEAYEGEHGPDTAEIVHQFDDGWTVRRLLYIRDALYEGTLQKHCMAGHDWPEGADNPDNVLDHGEGWDILSLRDPMNYPRVTFGLTLDREPVELHTLGFPKGETDPRFQARIDAFVQEQ